MVDTDQVITTLASDWTRLESVCYRFGVFLGLAHAAMTAEGDNSVLMQKVAKEHLAKMVKNPPKVSAPANNSVSNPDHVLYLLKVILASHWSIFFILSPHWSLLQGLSKSQESRDPERDNRDEVRDKCHEALTWLRDRPANTKCVTTKGSVLNNFSLAFEEDCSDGQVRNI